MCLRAGYCASLVLLFASWVPTAHSQLFKEYPDAIVCSVRALPMQTMGTQGGQLVFHIQARLNEGGAIYSAVVGSSRTVTVSADGTLKAENLADCDGKTVADLRRAGQAFDAYK